MDETLQVIELGQGVYGFTHPKPQYGNSNAGLLIDTDGFTLFDTTATPERGERLQAEVSQITTSLGTKLKRVVLSSSRIPFAGGSPTFWQAAFYGSQVASDQLDTPANTEAFRRLLPHLADSYHDSYNTRPITHVVSEASAVSPAGQAMVLPAESAGNLVLYVESVDVLFAGAIASFGVTPLAFDGFPQEWATNLEQLAQIAKTIIPGHGPAGGVKDLQDQAAYLRACIAAEGDLGAMASGPWESWENPEFTVVNVERAARLAAGDHSVPTAMFELLGFEPNTGEG